jgi:hypothetical protein
MSNDTKSSKYANAVNRATGQELETRNATQPAAALVVPAGLQGMVSAFTPDQVLVDMSKGDMEWAPFAIQMQEGMLLIGILEGRGGNVEIEEVDRVAGIVNIKQIATWVIRDPKTGVRGSFLTAAQLEDKLPPFVGGLIKIYVGAMLESRKGHRYRDFRVAGERLGNGQTRTFARQLPAPIDVAPTNENTQAEAAREA